MISTSVTTEKRYVCSHTNVLLQAVKTVEQSASVGNGPQGPSTPGGTGGKTPLAATPIAYNKEDSPTALRETMMNQRE
jgi:hypothetical protein